MVSEEDLYEDGEEVIILSEQYFGFRGIIQKRKKELLTFKLTQSGVESKDKFKEIHPYHYQDK